MNILVTNFGLGQYSVNLEPEMWKIVNVQNWKYFLSYKCGIWILDFQIYYSYPWKEQSKYIFKYNL